MKFGGYRAIAVLRAGRAAIRSRNLLSRSAGYPEVVALDAGGRLLFNCADAAVCRAGA